MNAAALQLPNNSRAGAERRHGVKLGFLLLTTWAGETVSCSLTKFASLVNVNYMIGVAPCGWDANRIKPVERALEVSLHMSDTYSERVKLFAVRTLDMCSAQVMQVHCECQGCSGNSVPVRRMCPTSAMHVPDAWCMTDAGRAVAIRVPGIHGEVRCL